MLESFIETGSISTNACVFFYNLTLCIAQTFEKMNPVEMSTFSIQTVVSNFHFTLK